MNTETILCPDCGGSGCDLCDNTGKLILEYEPFMYTTTNYKTKKALKEAVAAGQVVTVFQPNGDLTGRSAPENGRVYLEGPHYPEPHRWYAQAELKDGKIVKVV